MPCSRVRQCVLPAAGLSGAMANCFTVPTPERSSRGLPLEGVLELMIKSVVAVLEMCWNQHLGLHSAAAHKATVSCLSFLPCGLFAVSSSMRLWPI